MFMARNFEFFRDRSAFGWNFLFPFLIVAGFGILFGGKTHTEYKVGLFPCNTQTAAENMDIPEGFKNTDYLEFVCFQTMAEGLDKLNHHKIDFLLKTGPAPHTYWISDSSRKGYILEKVFHGSLKQKALMNLVEKKAISGREIRYIDWLFPGILAMNMMFSALWGVGYVIVRDRKNGVLNRLKATPLTAFEYLAAQMCSRIFLLMFTLLLVWIGCDLLFDFHVEGSYLTLVFVFFIGSLSLTSLGLILASRGTSEEFATGVLNFITWPMMFLSEVWFSLEGSPRWVHSLSKIFPLTHLLTAVRKIMNDGAGLMDIWPELAVLSMMTAIALIISAALFSWNK
jgi:ABC-type multidrug transport system permease subunit